MSTRRPCSGPWKTPTIDSKGNLTVCCHDKELSYKLGTLKTQSFDQLWFGNAADELRLKHLRGEFSKLGDAAAPFINCANCSGHESPKLRDSEVLSFLEQTGRSSFKEAYLDRVCRGFERIESLLVEWTDRCNLSCIMCRQKQAMLPPKGGFIDPELWKSILSDIRASNLSVKALSPFWYGEPFLHPKALEMLKYAFRLNYNQEYDRRLEQLERLGNKKLLKDFLCTHPFSNQVFDYMELHTNGELLNEKTIKYLFSKEGARSLGYLVFSLDALHDSTYSRIRRGGNFQKTVENLKLCLSLKSKLAKTPPNQLKNTVWPVIVLQFIVMRENAGEAEAFIDYWKGYMDSLGLPCQINGGYEPPFFKDTIFLRVLGELECEQQPQAWALHERVLKESKHFSSKPSKVPGGKKQSPAPSEFIRRPCAGPFKTPVIRWDGKLGVCCYDTKMRLALGNVQEYKLSWLWNLDSALNLRLAHIRNQLPKLCLNCPNLPSPDITDEEIVQYLDRASKPELILPYLQHIRNFKLMRDFL
jgi:sulfatase maturation enzyme AslB (radical SAM superfamily)